MRCFFTISAAAVLTASSLFAQNPNIDMTLWTEEHFNGNGPWTVDPALQFCSSTNNINTDCSVFYSDFDVTYLEFSMRIDPSGGDDDLAGFVLGIQPGDAINNPSTANYVVVDWKRLTQTYQDWGTANEGLAVSQMQGSWSPGFGGGPIDLWSHTLNCTELARGNQFGSVGWEFGRTYEFTVLYTNTSLDIWIDGNQEFGLAGNFPTGRFGAYQFSQVATEIQFPIPGSFATVGTGCVGSAGTPYMFSPVDPYVGEDIPVIVADVPPGAPVFLALGLSDTSWNGVPLPLSLASLGAPTCTLYSSPDVVSVIGNFNGTAYTVLPQIPGITPSATPILFAQALALDPTANNLGLVFSNGGAIAIGIR